MVIKGYSKSAGYQPGVRFEDNRFRNSWNAVFVAGAWRFVQCNWGARHLVNAKEVPKPGSKSKSDSLRYKRSFCSRSLVIFVSQLTIRSDCLVCFFFFVVTNTTTITFWRIPKSSSTNFSLSNLNGNCLRPPSRSKSSKTCLLFVRSSSATDFISLMKTPKLSWSLIPQVIRSITIELKDSHFVPFTWLIAKRVDENTNRYNYRLLPFFNWLQEL